MTDKKDRKVTPIGFSKWAYLQKPKDPFTDKKGKAKGGPKYQIDVCFTAEDPAWKVWGSELRAAINSLPIQMDENTGNGMSKQMPIKKEVDETDKPTGRFFVTFKTGEQFKPKVFDKEGKEIDEKILIGNESKVRVAYTPVPYDAFGGGFALYLNAVQVIDLVEYKPATAEAFGFTTEKNTASTNPPPPEDDGLPF